MTRQTLTIIILLTALAGVTHAELTPEQAQRVDALVRDLGAKDFAAREQAVRELIAIGPDVIERIAKTLASTDDPEVRLRCGQVLKGMRLIERRIVDLGAVFTDHPTGGWRRSQNGEARFWTDRTGGGTSFFINGKRIADHPQIGAFSVSADGKHYAYAVRKNHIAAYVMHDGVKGPGYGEVGWPYLSREGRLAYTARKGDMDHRVVLDGVEGRQYHTIWLLRPWTEDGHLVYAAGIGGTHYIVIDGIEGPSHDEVWLSKEGRSNRYVVADAGELWSMEAEWPDLKLGKKARIGEKKVELLGKVPPDLKVWGNVYVTADAKHVWFGYMQSDRPAYHNGTRIDGIINWIPSSDGNHVTAIARRKDGKCVIIDGLEGPAFDDVGNPIFSGRHWAYRATRGKESFVVHDGGQFGPFARIQSVALSPNGKLVCLAYRGGQLILEVDGEARAVHRSTREVRLSPDGRHVVEIVRDDRKGAFLIIDGLRTPEYERIGTVRFSPDGRHLCHDARRDGRQFMVCDGIEGPAHEQVSMLGFSSVTDKSFRYIAVDDGRETLMEIDWPRGIDCTNGRVPLQPRR